MDVTTTSTKIGKFDARFFHLVFEEEFAKVTYVDALLVLRFSTCLYIMRIKINKLTCF